MPAACHMEHPRETYSAGQADSTVRPATAARRSQFSLKALLGAITLLAILVAIALKLARSPSSTTDGLSVGSDFRTVGPDVVIRDDVIRYRHINFFRPSGGDRIIGGEAFPNEAGEGPFLWLGDQVIDVGSDTRESLKERFNLPDDSSQAPERIFIGGIMVTFQEGRIEKVRFRQVMARVGISVAKDSERVTLPCSTDELIEQLGKPRAIKHSR